MSGFKIHYIYASCKYSLVGGRSRAHKQTSGDSLSCFKWPFQISATRSFSPQRNSGMLLPQYYKQKYCLMRRLTEIKSNSVVIALGSQSSASNLDQLSIKLGRWNTCLASCTFSCGGPVLRVVRQSDQGTKTAVKYLKEKNVVL